MLEYVVQLVEPLSASYGCRVEQYIFMGDFHNGGLGHLHLGPERVEVARVEGRTQATGQDRTGPEFLNVTV